MLDDVIPPCGGYLPVRIDKYGYIRHNDTYSGIVHLETRNLNLLSACEGLFSAAKASLPDREDAAILELTPQGGGASIWVKEG